MTASNTLNGII